MKNMILIQKMGRELVKDFSTRLKDFARDLKRCAQLESTESNFPKLTKFSIKKVAYVISLKYLTPLKKDSPTSG
jgi:hypothetical protein